MPKFKLLAGQHIQADPDAKPDKVTGRKPSRTYRVGETIESETDLVAKFGATKFQLVGNKGSRKGNLSSSGRSETQSPGDPSSESMDKSATVAPNGQVSTGFQTTSGNKGDGSPVSGPIAEEDLPEPKQGQVKATQPGDDEEDEEDEESEGEDEEEGEESSTKSAAAPTPTRATRPTPVRSPRATKPKTE